MRISPSVLRFAAAVGLATTLTGCIFQDQNIPAAVSNPMGATQTVAVGAVAPQPLMARVVDQDRNPIEGVTVRWEIKSGSGTLSQTETTTNGDGEATVTFTAGNTTGTTVVLAIVPLLGSAVSYSIKVQ